MGGLKLKKSVKLGIQDFILVPFLYSVLVIGLLFFLYNQLPISIAAAMDTMTANHAPRFSYTLYKVSYVNKSDVHYPTRGQKYATLRIENAELEENLCLGDDERTIKKNLGTYEFSGLPGEGKPILVAGHNGTIFKRLPYAQVGDIVEIETTWGKYHYQIYNIEIIKATDWDTSILNDQEEILIMYTCYPFDQVDVPDRYFVYAEMIDGPKIMEDE